MMSKIISKKTARVKFLVADNTEMEVLTEGSKTLLELALDSDLMLLHSCGGMGTCGTCRCFVLSETASLAAPNEIESELRVDRGFAENERLSCQLTPKQELVVDVRHHFLNPLSDPFEDGSDTKKKFE